MVPPGTAAGGGLAGGGAGGATGGGSAITSGGADGETPAPSRAPGTHSCVEGALGLRKKRAPRIASGITRSMGQKRARPSGAGARAVSTTRVPSARAVSPRGRETEPSSAARGAGSAARAADFCSPRSAAMPGTSRRRAWIWLPSTPNTSGPARPSRELMVSAFTPEALAAPSVTAERRAPKSLPRRSLPRVTRSSPLPALSRSVMLAMGPRRPASWRMPRRRRAPEGEAPSAAIPATTVGVAVSSALRVVVGLSPTRALALSMTSGVR